MMRPSTHLSRCIRSITVVNILFFSLGIVLSLLPDSIFATTTTSSSSNRAARPRITAASKPYYILPFFLPDSEPLSLVASVIHKTTIITTTIIRPTTTINSLSIKTLVLTTTSRPTSGANSNNQDHVELSENNKEEEEEITLQIDCPTALTPENEACRSARIYPALVTGRRRIFYDTDELVLAPETQVWKGETTYLVGDDTTTTWTCWQGMSLRTVVRQIFTPTQMSPTPSLPAEILNPGITANPGPVQVGQGRAERRNAVLGQEVVPYAQCVSTIVQNQGRQIRFVTRRYHECYFYRHMVPIVVDVDIAGDGIWRQESLGGEEEADSERMNSGWKSKLSRLGCDDPKGASRTLWAGSVTEAHAAVATGTGDAAGGAKTSGSVGRLRGGSILSRGGLLGIAGIVAVASGWMSLELCACL